MYYHTLSTHSRQHAISIYYHTQCTHSRQRAISIYYHTLCTHRRQRAISIYYHTLCTHSRQHVILTYYHTESTHLTYNNSVRSFASKRSYINPCRPDLVSMDLAITRIRQNQLVQCHLHRTNSPGHPRSDILQRSFRILLLHHHTDSGIC